MKTILTASLIFFILFSHSSLLLAASKKESKKSIRVVKLSPIEQGTVKAVESCDSDALNIFLSKGVSPNLVIDSSGSVLSSVLQIRGAWFSKRCDDTLDLLIKNKIHLNHQIGDVTSLTHAAITNLEVPKKTLELMRQYGANFDAPKICTNNSPYSNCVSGRSPLMDLVNNSNLDISIVSGSILYSPLKSDHFQYVVDNTKINSRDAKGQTALHIATINRSMNVIKFLLNAGADPTIKDSKGLTAGDLAISSGNINMIKLYQ